MSVEATLVAKIIDLINEIALDQIEQDIEANTKFALKSELINPVLLEEWIAFYNAYMGTSLNWQDYLDFCKKKEDSARLPNKSLSSDKFKNELVYFK